MVGRTVNLSPTKEISPPEPSTKEKVAAVAENVPKPEEDNEGRPSSEDTPTNGITSPVDSNKILSCDDNPPPLTTGVTRPPEDDDEERNTDSGDLITVQVKDHLGVVPGATEAQLFVYRPDITIGEFFIDVSSRFSLDLGEFDIIYQDKFFSYNLAGLPEDNNFSGLNIKPDRERVYKMSLELAPKKRKTRAMDSSRELVHRNLSNDLDVALISSGLTSLSCGRDYVGLKNRNMTCYLNSFLQGLWFTPEFRNVVYNYFYEDGRFNRKSLCAPVQKLFLQLQFSNRDSIDTDDLIKTFGWEDRETWNQHDIEELCSIFMDNLITEFKGTPMDGIIQALYFGTLDDYVKCLECNRVSQRTDDFLVIPLPIRNFGSLLANPTLEAALNSFVAYEELDGNNMYNCSQCQKPCPAHKGFKFNRLPYILTIQLKRFEYDFIKDRRLKLNDRVAFPFILDMNPYIEKPSPDRRDALKIDLIRPKSLDGERNQGHSRPIIQLVDPADPDNPDNPEGSDNTAAKGAGAAGGSEPPSIEIMKELVKTNGPEIYQLYGVMVHRGGINSGHYYAYILDFERDRWYRCDDAVIRKASISDIEGAYGGVSDEDRELTSAYMLLYRRFDTELNLLPYYLNEMPQHMQEMWTTTAELDKQLQAEEELAKNTIRMNCFMRDTGTQELIEKILQIPKTMSVADAAVLISQEFADMMPFPDIVSSDKLRLCRFDKDLLIIESSFDGMEEENIVLALRKHPPRTKNEALFLERKKVELNFQSYSADDIVFRTHLVDCQQQVILPPREVHALPTSSVNDLKKTIVSELELVTNETEVIMTTQYMGHFTTIIGDKHPLTLFNFERINDIYAQPGSEVDLADKVLTFVEQYTRAEVILIYAQAPQIPAPVETPTVETVQPEEPVNKLAEEKPATKEETSSTLPVIQSKEPETTSPSSSATVVVNGDVGQETVVTGGGDLSPSKETPDGTLTPPKKEYFIQLACTGTAPEENIMAYTLRIDGQTPLYSLSKYISNLISVPESDFIFYKADKTETTELRKMTDRIATLKPFDHLYVKLGHRLQNGEFRIPVFLLNVSCALKPIQYLTEIVATLGMTVDEVRSTIIKKCAEYNCDFKVDKSRLRVRKKLRTNPSKIMREHMKIQDLFSPYTIQTGELYVQLVDDASTITEKNYSMVYRHWHPSTGVLDPPVEVTIFHDYSADLEDVILAKLHESLGYADEIELEAAKPDTGFPWEVPPRLIGDLGWFSLEPSMKKSLYVYSDELALFVRDKKETAMDLELLEPFRPRYMLNEVSSPSNTADNQRKETGLKLNLGTSPSS